VTTNTDPLLYLDIDGVLLRRRHAGMSDAFEIAPDCLDFLKWGSSQLRGGQKVILHWDRQPSIVHVARNQLYDMGNEGLSAIIWQRQELRCNGCTAQPAGNKPRGHWIAHSSMLKADADILQPRIIGKLPQFLGRVERERQVKSRLRVCTKELANTSDRRNKKWLPFKRAPDIKGDPSTWGKDSRHFPHRRSAIREILQPLLAQHHIEAVGFEWQLSHAPLVPLNLRVAASDAQHAFVDVDSRYIAELAADQIDTTRYDTCAAGNIEHAITIPATSREDETVGPRLHDFKREAGIGCRRVTAKLESTYIAHLPTWCF
jgi:hypothetical protein